MTTTPHPVKRIKAAANSAKEVAYNGLALIGFVSAAITAITLYSIFVLMAMEFLEQHGIIAEFQSAGIGWALQYILSYPAYVMFAAGLAALVQNARFVLGQEIKAVYTRRVAYTILGVGALGAALEVAIVT